MKLTDVNLLLYAADGSAPRHRRARRWLEEQLSGTEAFGFAWVVLLAFLRLSTNPRIFERPLPVQVAFEMVEGWLAQPPATIVHPTERHAAVLKELLEPLGTAGNLTTDAHLAALAIEHRAELCSSDADFSRFAGVRWRDPLREA
ncbi:MAG: type II toxin-antitoxin system VapC family toxin [Actinomycetota bacterium]|nr:type II toxin-antitoxin system VapC family toxin [Actinomycetota bacterium]